MVKSTMTETCSAVLRSRRNSTNTMLSTCLPRDLLYMYLKWNAEPKFISVLWTEAVFHLMARPRKWRETCLKLQPCDDAVCTFCFLSRDSTFALVLVCHQWTLAISLYSLTALYQSASGLHNYLVERCRRISGSYLPLRAQWSKSLMAVVSVDDI